MSSCDLLNNSITPPMNLKENDALLSWDKVSKASSYIVNIEDIVYTVSTNKFDLSILMDIREYCIKVKAVKNNIESEWSDIFEYNPVDKLLELYEYEIVLSNVVILEYLGKEKDIVIPYGVHVISSQAFINRTFVESVYIPLSVIEIGLGAFSGCTNLNRISIPFVGGSKINTEEYFHFGYIFGEEFYEDGQYIDSLFRYYIPLSLETVEVYAEEIYALNFIDCISLKNIILSDNIERIGSSAFQGCYNLEYIYLPKCLKTIEQMAFAGCENLNNIVLPFGLEFIESSCFAYCYNLEEIILPNSLLKLGSSVFLFCTSLTSIIIPDSVIYIMGDYLFGGCTNLTSITIPYINETFGKLFERGSYYGGEFTYQGTTYYIPKSITTVVVTLATYFRPNVFMNCKNLVSISLLSAVYLSQYMFFNCESLSNLYLSRQLYWISSETFSNCISLTKIYIPKSVEIIGPNTFATFDNLIIYCEVDSLPSSWDLNWNPNNMLVIWGYTE